MPTAYITFTSFQHMFVYLSLLRSVIFAATAAALSRTHTMAFVVCILYSHRIALSLNPLLPLFIHGLVNKSESEIAQNAMNYDDDDDNDKE